MTVMTSSNGGVAVVGGFGRGGNKAAEYDNDVEVHVFADDYDGDDIGEEPALAGGVNVGISDEKID